MSIYSLYGIELQQAYDIYGNEIDVAYNIYGNIIFKKSVLPDLPVPSGNLNASSIVRLPDLYEQGKGFTCTGLTYDKTTDTFIVGDIKALQPGDTMPENGQLVRMSSDFSTVLETIQLPSKTVQGVTFDSIQNNLWIADPNSRKIYNVSTDGTTLSFFKISRPTGIVYSSIDNTLWVLTYKNEILHCAVDGTIIESFNFAYQETLDQCFLDEKRGWLYITAGTNYQGRNNIYLFDTVTHEQSIKCTVDSYAVEGIWIGENGKMVIMNDGYYHSAAVPYNQANIYTIQ